ncbi:hypothetical protein P154DRAFT_567380 [Amniculicola lignicola CBS 123094]|uniref:Uncharacterized protein n=1 Tax=Amniculicola lignicola CBS 123094 TaxID=1392246 RepID=A0A6A5W076_9PLEO|nr:hypothetical protein P154DRAFT_567380 [Amniculicola lignicola CBS 123094]
MYKLTILAFTLLASFGAHAHPSTTRPSSPPAPIAQPESREADIKNSPLKPRLDDGLLSPTLLDIALPSPGRDEWLPLTRRDPRGYGPAGVVSPDDQYETRQQFETWQHQPPHKPSPHPHHGPNPRGHPHLSLHRFLLLSRPLCAPAFLLRSCPLTPKLFTPDHGKFLDSACYIGHDLHTPHFSGTFQRCLNGLELIAFWNLDTELFCGGEEFANQNVVGDMLVFSVESEAATLLGREMDIVWPPTALHWFPWLY